MAKIKIESLITQLHDMFGDDETSPEQAKLMADLQNHVHDWDQPDTPDPSINETAQSLLHEFEASHPKAAAVIRQIMSTLEDIGI